ncbi:MAG: hypothetical protein K0Q55_2426, partial [Verrucomicrobia bacterium]|nr:hypothetical protein [Verrucomicrobiota bacterium]
MNQPAEPPEPLPGKDSLSSARGKPLVPVWVRVGIYLLIIGLVAAVAVPNFMKRRTTVSVNTCIVNLKNMNRAVQQWAAA